VENEALELMNLQQRAGEIYNMQLKDRSRKAYRGSQIRFILWFAEKIPHIVPGPFLEALYAISSMKAKKDFITTVLGPPVRIDQPPLIWDALNSKNFDMWIL
jgi:hypothetical protein